MESSLSILRGSRLQRLKETNCIYIAPGIEAWTSYSNKAGVGAMAPKEKLQHVVEHFRVLREYVPVLQANFMFGSEVDHGDEPVELTKEFIRSLPYVWPTVNIPTPFGNTPLYDRALAKGSLLKLMPFSFYYTPYLVTTIPNYPPVEYYDKLIDIYSAMTSARMLTRRLVTKSTIGLSLLHALRTFSLRQDLATFRRLQQELKTDRAFRSFHEGRSVSLPEFYHRSYEEKLGRYASLVSRTERIPEMEKPVSNPPPAMSLAT